MGTESEFAASISANSADKNTRLARVFLDRFGALTICEGAMTQCFTLLGLLRMVDSRSVATPQCQCCHQVDDRDCLEREMATFALLR
jgi:hypothetical protein